jgi:hypothetical protein
MAFFISERGRKMYVVLCKGCKRNVPAGIIDPPTSHIIVRCVLCREIRRYYQTEVGLDYPHYEVLKRLRGVR